MSKGDTVAGARRRFFSPRRLYLAYKNSLTTGGKSVMWGTIVAAALGVNTQHNRIYMVFAVLFGVLMAAVFASLLARPRVEVTARIARRIMAGESAPWRIEVTAGGDAAVDDAWVVLEGLPAGVTHDGNDDLGVCHLAPGEKVSFAPMLRFARRGVHDLAGVRVTSTHPFGLVANGTFHRVPARVLAHPRFQPLERFNLSLGRRLHPGGLVLAHSVGDSTEFISTREYRAGDPMRKLHAASWARTGVPVVRVDQEEYYARVALVVDTSDPRGGARLERAASAAAAIVDWIVRHHYLVELVAAGPDLYTITAGRGMAHLEQVLDILACLEPAAATSFARIAPEFFVRISRVSTVILLLLDWDEERAAFAERLSAMGAAVDALVLGVPSLTPPSHVRVIPENANLTVALGSAA